MEKREWVMIVVLIVALTFFSLLFLGRQTAFKETAQEQKMRAAFAIVYRQEFHVEPCEHESMPVVERCTELQTAFMNGQNFAPNYAKAEEVSAYAKLGVETRRSLKNQSQ